MTTSDGETGARVRRPWPRSNKPHRPARSPQHRRPPALSRLKLPPTPTTPPHLTDNMYKLDLKEAAALSRRRDLEVQRQNRIFNAKVRLIGVDKQALDTQVRDNQIQKEKESEKHEAFAKDLIKHDQAMVLLDERYKKDMKNLNKAIIEFRQEYQRPEMRREFDLYDPQALKKSLPARISDDDPRCTISSMQKLVGEDIKQRERIKQQQEQFREWSLAQQNELKKALVDKKHADSLFDKNRIDLDRRACELQTMEEQTRRAVTITTKDFNRAQAMENAVRCKLEKQQTEDDNLTEIKNQLRGDLLSENPKQAISAFGEKHVIPSHWKGMSREELDDIYRTQKVQVEEKKRLNEEERQRNAEWDRNRVNDARAAILFERQQKRENRQIRRTLDCHNSHLWKERNARENFLKNNVYVNVPTCKYFDQFNTTTR
ncbi:RIB43A-like with coiled-coils protein 2 [Callorhinchus milii]|uniref:RIB43A domain with coiled-coils 2 n=2 Tax=Callorhinchus milii TaxID=7868 RepID=A0A4W3J172_CALMI|nr:RIB43A-like with coiled-coils protein 2 [Callorhinchus milii]|eukprot:gi/632954302/ref/XP_007892886.1/ PREDICTED: RIB43A-like with coiled-coils protein 2 [Callorhinchus milii]